MAETVVLDPAAVAVARTALDVTGFVNDEGIDWGDAAIEQYQAQAQRGQKPVDYRVPNRIVTIPLLLRTRQGTSFDQIRTKLQAKTAMFQREGGWISRQTAIGTVYADVFSATLKLGGSSLQATSGIDSDAVLSLECDPDWYRDEVTLDAMTETTAAVLVKVAKKSGVDAVIAGDYPGRVRIVVNDDQGQAQLGLLWGIRSRYYDAAASAALQYEAEALTPLDTAAIATVTGASGGASNNVVRHASLAALWTPVLSTQILSGGAQMTHRGTYRVWARCHTTSPVPPRVRLAWDVGDFSFPSENAAWTIPFGGQFYWADLGEIRLDASPVGSHRWQGVIQAQGEAGGENISIDVVAFQPIDDGAGRITAQIPATQGLQPYSARDEFNQAAGALNGKTLPVGGTWARAGDADDYTVNATAHTLERTALADAAEIGCFALAGSSTFTTIVVGVEISKSSAAVGQYQGVVARYFDTINYLRAILVSYTTLQPDEIRVQKIVAGVKTDLCVPIQRAQSAAHAVLQLFVHSTGLWAVWLYSPGGAFPGIPVAAGRDSALATGGALASGRVGIYDERTGGGVALTRTYDNFNAYVPEADAVLFANQSAELRTDEMFREDITGAAYAPIVPDRGNLPRVPPSGLEGRKVELFLKGSRGDFDQLPDSGIDDISAQAFVRPCWLFVPDGT